MILKIFIKEEVRVREGAIERKIKQVESPIISPYMVRVFKPMCIWTPYMARAPGSDEDNLSSDNPTAF